MNIEFLDNPTKNPQIHRYGLTVRKNKFPIKCLQHRPPLIIHHCYLFTFLSRQVWWWRTLRWAGRRWTGSWWTCRSAGGRGCTCCSPRTLSPSAISQSINQSTNQSVNRSINQTIDQLINQSISKPINQSNNRSIIQSINQSIN